MHMNPLKHVLLATCALGLVTTTPADARDRDKDKKKNNQETAAPASSSSRGGIVPGSCQAATAESELSANNVRARIFNNGSLFYSNTSTAEYIVQDNASIFASGIWIGGKVDGEILTAGATYDDFEFWPGPLGDDARPVDPTDCSEYDRIWNVSVQDVENYEAGLNLARDLEEWPIELGAPVLAAPDNEIDDDGDGLVDEGTDGIDNDDDGNVDERDERERVDPDVRRALGLPIYDLAAGDRPDIILDQSLWWVMNDVGNVHSNTGSAPLGVEVRGQVFAVGEAGPLGNTTFYKYTIINKSNRDINETYLSVFSDPDLGNEFQDDFVGSNLDLSLGYVYNEDNVDTGGYGYGVPAVGYDFFQGPIVAGDTLGLTGFNYFINGVDALADPESRLEFYNVMEGRLSNGNQLTIGGEGIDPNNPPAQFAFPGNPITGEGWNEVSAGNVGNDRRFTVTTGPFILEAGAAQDIVFGIVWSRAQAGPANQANVASVAQLFVDDLVAQQAYDNDFEIQRAPPAPPVCNPASDLDFLQPSSGSCLTAAEEDGNVVLSWGYPESSSNFNASFREQGVVFEGFNIYRYGTAGFANPERVATIDKVNGRTLQVNLIFNPDLALLGVDPLVPEVAAFGTDSGLRYYYEVPTDLVNNRDYYYGVTAYGIDPEAPLQRVFESLPAQITVRPTLQSGIANGGTTAQSNVNDATVFLRSGDGFTALAARVINPRLVRDAVYTVRILAANEDSTLTTYSITRTLEDGTSTVLFDGLEAFEETSRLPELEDQIVFDGLAFFDVGSTIPEPDFQSFADQTIGIDDLDEFDIAGTGVLDGDEVAGLGIVETTSPAGDPCATGALGCDLYDGNTVFGDVDITGGYFVAPVGLNPDPTRFTSRRNVSGADDYELRFSESCTDDVTPCYGLYYAGIIGGLDESIVVRVPFEAYAVGLTENDDTEDVADDDVRLIPVIRPASEDEKGDDIFYDSFDNSYVTRLAVPDAFAVPADTVTVSDEVYLYYPTEEGGYEEFASAAASSGGAGATYMDTFAGDPECDRSFAYADFCYRSDVAGGSNNFVVGRIQFADADGDGVGPRAGTTVRFNFIRQRPALAVGDVYTLDASDIAALTGQTEVAEDALSRIGVTPNPYRGRSAYERDSNDRLVRFVNLPEQAQIRIYTVAGTLIRTIDKSGLGSTIDWNLETENNLPVASGMYLIHVEARDGDGNRIGERVLKLGVIQRRTRVNIF